MLRLSLWLVLFAVTFSSGLLMACDDESCHDPVPVETVTRVGLFGRLVTRTVFSDGAVVVEKDGLSRHKLVIRNQRTDPEIYLDQVDTLY